MMVRVVRNGALSAATCSSVASRSRSAWSDRFIVAGRLRQAGLWPGTTFVTGLDYGF
jgi:hypothetical protein